MTIGMDGEPKKEKDYKEILDAKLPEIEKNAKGNLTGALDALMVLEKQTRVAADQASNSRVLILILQLCYNEKNLKLLNDNIILLSKKHGFLKACVTKMVQHAMTFLDGITDQKNKLEMIDTLRTVTEGKIFVEVERARVTRILSKIKEDQGNVAEACDILHDLQVETFGSMEKREKTDFILEQMRLCLAKMDFTKVVIISKKINLKYFKDVENHDLKLRYCELMIKLYLKEEKYFEICKLYYQVYDTPSIKADEAKLVDTVQNIVLFVVLSSYNNEQSDFIHRTYEDPNLSKLPLYKEFLKCFITNELVRWPKIDEIYGNVIKQTFVFKSVGAAGNDGEKRWKELHKRVIEHNIRVIAKYYKRISVKRITQLLDLDSDEAEKFLSNLVVAKTIYARIDRPAGIITFQAKQDANALLNEWSGKVEGILGLIAKTTHLITKEEMVQEIVKN